MKKVLLFVPRMNIGGAESYVFTLASELYNRGYDVYVASSGGKLSDKLKKMGIKTFFIPVRLSKFLSLVLLKKIVEKYNIDIVHANSGAAGEIAAKLKRYLNIKVVYTAHGRFGNIKKEIIINEVDRIICVSNCVREEAVTQGFDPQKLITIYNGVDIDKFSPSSALREKYRTMYHINDNELVLAIVSRVKNLTNKGHEDLLKIFSENALRDNWKLIVIGKGNGLFKLKYKIKLMNISHKILCLGHITNVNEVLNMADLVVLPTKYETFGLVLAEGMAMGKPAIAYNVGGTSEVIVNGETGYLVEYKNVDQLYEKIKFLDKDRKKLTLMSEKGQAYVVENFSSKQMVDKIEKIYKEVLSE